ncbi:MAG: zinc-dependent alcohol dehydrogenase family protein [Candidatus Heimdallarchaeota archaeon]|nr:MAG: zinc-dependent alcohol dehydrogenase family protein [Candidatus Heimdallarchaeota archaeon]
MRMKVASFNSPYNIEIREVKVPTFGMNDLLVKVAYSGICGTDLHIFEGKNPFVSFPIIPGHEFAGVIKSFGSKVDDFSINEKVAINPNLSCKDQGYAVQDFCYYCKKNRPHFCLNWQAIGVTRNGGFAEYVVCPNTAAFRVPQEVSIKEAALMEPIACCLHGLKRLNIISEHTVLLIGAGPIGLLMILLIKSMFKSRIIVSETDNHRRNLATNLGADLIVNPDVENLGEIVKNETDGHGVDASIEAVGSPITALEAISLLNKGGKSLIFGVAEPEDVISLNLFKLYSNETSIFGSFTNPHENNESLEILRKKLIPTSSLVSHELTIGEVGQGLMLMKDEGSNINKILIKFE